MKAAAAGDPPRWRTLADPRDVDAFLADVDRVPAWQAAVARFLGEPVTPAR